MTFDVKFQLQIKGADADKNEVPAYDGYMSLAGFSWTLSLVTHYLESGKIRHRGDFDGRTSVKTVALSRGSVISDFVASISQDPLLLGIGGAAGTLTLGLVTNFLYDILKRTIDRNLGNEVQPRTNELDAVSRMRGGDLEALVAAVEPAVRQSHMVIGNGATLINITGGHNRIGRFDEASKNYVTQTIEDRSLHERDLSVASLMQIPVLEVYLTAI